MLKAARGKEKEKMVQLGVEITELKGTVAKLTGELENMNADYRKKVEACKKFAFPFGISCTMFSVLCFLLLLIILV